LKALSSRGSLLLVLLVVMGTGCGNRVSPTGAAAAVVYGTRSGKKYHVDGCTYLSKSRIPMTLQEAVDKGLTPCSKCFPPVLEKEGQ